MIFSKMVEIETNKELRVRKLMGFNFLDEPLPEFLSRDGAVVVNTINPHSWVCAQTDSEFNCALQKTDIIIADGVGISIASRILQGRPVFRTTGADLWRSLMNELLKRNGSCFYLGSTPEVLGGIERHIRENFPSVTYCGYSPPFCNDFTEAQIDTMVSAINDFNPDVLFVGITAPRQEKLVNKIHGKVSPKVIASIGAVFDFVAGSQPRAPKIMQKVGFEWVYRLIKEPRRMWRRNFISTPLFLLAVVKYRIFGIS
jgi:N-acetylglucosaminyldiphosphoundecaprenol N-acetyl-beta-D-mannosaminyltransferase